MSKLFIFLYMIFVGFLIIGFLQINVGLRKQYCFTS